MQTTQQPGDNPNPEMARGTFRIHMRGLDDEPCWVATALRFPHITVFARTHDELIARISEEIRLEFEAIERRLEMLADATTGRADRIADKFRLFESRLCDIEELLASEPNACFSVSPIFEHLAHGYAGKLEAAGLDRLAVIAGSARFDFGLGLVRTATEDLERGHRLRDLVSRRPGITQFQARKTLDIDKDDVRRVLKYMEAFGVVRREATAKTNKLYPGGGQ